MVPIYDDVGYLIDGLQRLAVLDRAGIAGFLLDLGARPAHAPLTAVTATFGLMVSGGAAWGPYFLSAVWVLALVMLGYFVLRGAALWSRVGILTAILAAPLFGHVLAEFRPDPVWGLLVGLAMGLSAAQDLLAAGRRRLFVLGLVFGAAVVAKPSAAPASALVLAAGFIVQLGLTMHLAKRWNWRVPAMVTLGAFCFVLPFLYTNGVATFEYIRMVMSTEGSVWGTQASTWGHMSYYLKRDYSILMLGWVWYAAIPVFVVCGALLLKDRDRRALPGFLGLMLAVATAYVIVTSSAVKSPLIGSILYGTVIAAVAWCLGWFFTRVRVRGWLVAAAGAIVFATQWTPSARLINSLDPTMQATEAANRAALPVVLEALRIAARPSVLVTVPGPAYAGSLEFFVKQRVPAASFVSGYTWRTWEQFEQGIVNADVVVMSEAGMSGQALGFSFPSVEFQPRLLDYLRANADFRGTRAYTDPEGRAVWVFVRPRN